MFGKVREVPQTELTPFYPRSPYGVSKVFAHYITVNYRESYDLFAVLGHAVQPRVAAPRPRVRDAQGDRRRRAHQAGPGRHAVARQPRRAARLGLCRRLRAGDVADAAAGPRRTTTSSRPASATRSATSSRSRSRHAGLDWNKYVRLDPALIRPAEVEHLIGDSSKARAAARMDARPSTSRRLVKMMVDADLQRVARRRAPRRSTLGAVTLAHMNPSAHRRPLERIRARTGPCRRHRPRLRRSAAGRRVRARRLRRHRLRRRRLEGRSDQRRARATFRTSPEADLAACVSQPASCARRPT
mgnify:CR=1 FL=1